MRILALPTACLVATIGYGATLLESQMADVPFARPSGEVATIAWTQQTGSYLGSASVQCPLAPSYDCHAVLFDEVLALAGRRSPQSPAPVFESSPPLPAINPYSGTFVTFPFR
jgi:hypothetical protein